MAHASSGLVEICRLGDALVVKHLLDRPQVREPLLQQTAWVISIHPVYSS